jgi:hypothetical protein
LLAKTITSGRRGVTRGFGTVSKGASDHTVPEWEETSGVAAFRP